MMAGDIVLNHGHAPFVPHLFFFWDRLNPRKEDEWIELGLEWLKECDALIRLEGESKGADQEVIIADQLGIDVYYSIGEWINAIAET